MFMCVCRFIITCLLLAFLQSHPENEKWLPHFQLTLIDARKYNIFQIDITERSNVPKNRKRRFKLPPSLIQPLLRDSFPTSNAFRCTNHAPPTISAGN